MFIRHVVLATVLTVMTTFGAIAQESGAFFGDQNQPGSRLHANILQLVENGSERPSAVKGALDTSLTDESSTLTGEAKAAVAFDIPLANGFYNEMLESNSLIEVVKVLVETTPEKAVQVITLAVVLYPDFAQEVFDGAALTGVMLPEDILVAALQAGADPTTISDATAAGATAAGPLASIVPLGAGIGAGGTGGGDTTASTN